MNFKGRKLDDKRKKKEKKKVIAKTHNAFTHNAHT
jgi:hypothetical protein